MNRRELKKEIERLEREIALIRREEKRLDPNALSIYGAREPEAWSQQIHYEPPDPKDEWQAAQMGIVTQRLNKERSKRWRDDLVELEYEGCDELPELKDKEEAEARYQSFVQAERIRAAAEAQRKEREAELAKEEQHWHDRHIRREKKVQAAAKAGRQPYSKVQPRSPKRGKAKGVSKAKKQSVSPDNFEAQIEAMKRKLEQAKGE